MPRRKKADPSLDAEAAEMLDALLAENNGDIDAVQEFLRLQVTKTDHLKDLVKFRFQPVGVREFVESPVYMNKPNTLWPEVMNALEAICDGTYTECLLTGAIGVAKSTLALYIQAYQVYILSCMRNPHKSFDLDESSEIVIVFQSITEALAKAVDYARFRDMISKAPYFKRHFPFDRHFESELRFPNRIIVKPVAGTDTAAIGQNVIGGLIDEINFMAVVENSKLSHNGGEYDQAAQNYNTISVRRASRFAVQGYVPGMLCIVSSRNYPGQFTNTIEERAKTNPQIYVYDKRLWEIRPERFSGEKFRVFVGDANRKPRILGENEIIQMADDPLVMAIPVENRKAFDNDMLRSLRDIAGVATQALHPFMSNIEAVVGSFGKVFSILSREDCDFKTTKVQIYPKRIINPIEPRWAHIDLAFSKDSAGLAVGHVPSFKAVTRGQGIIEMLPNLVYDLLLEIQPPKGGEIEFEYIRQLLYKLRDVAKLPIKWVTLDTFQSKDTQQILHQQGFITGVRSMDTDTLAYDITKQAIYDGRVAAPLHPKAQKELLGLEFHAKEHKIDHPPRGSKDVVDAMAGVACGLTRQREIWNRHKIPLRNAPSNITSAPKPVEQPSYDAVDRARVSRGVAPRRNSNGDPSDDLG